MQDIEKIIEKTVNKTITKLKIAGLMRDDSKDAFQKTEELLRSYRSFCLSEEETAKKMVAQITVALSITEDDPYCKIIQMYYMDGKTREEIAEYFNTTATTISRNKKRLVEKLRTMLFSEETIKEIYS